jgi:hypothetical protein
LDHIALTFSYLGIKAIDDSADTTEVFNKYLFQKNSNCSRKEEETSTSIKMALSEEKSFKFYKTKKAFMLKCIIGESYKMKQILKVLYVHYKSIY